MTNRARRSCLIVPGSSERMLTKARSIAADEVVIDLEDAVAPDAKAHARKLAVSALGADDWAAGTLAVRVNDWSTAWTFRDVTELVVNDTTQVDCLVLPKAETATDVAALDLLVTQVERDVDFDARADRRIGFEVQIETAHGLANVHDIAVASPRVEALVFGPIDYAASLGATTLNEPAYDFARAGVAAAAKAHGLQAIDGPYVNVHDRDGLRHAADHAAGMGFDGMWAIHPDQVDTVNSAFTPTQDEYDHAERLIETYDWHRSEAGGKRGAAMLGDEMIDEASRRVAEAAAAKGRAAGMTRTKTS